MFYLIRNNQLKCCIIFGKNRNGCNDERIVKHQSIVNQPKVSNLKVKKRETQFSLFCNNLARINSILYCKFYPELYFKPPYCEYFSTDMLRCRLVFSSGLHKNYNFSYTRFRVRKTVLGARKKTDVLVAKDNVIRRQKLY